MRLYLTIRDQAQRDELKEHLERNGYNVGWISDDVIEVDEEEKAYIAGILYDRFIPFTDNINEQWFGNKEMKKMLDIFYSVAREIMSLTEDIGEYSDEENEVIEEVANVINIYENTFV